MKIWNLRVQKNLNIEKIIFKVVQIKFLAMHITNQKLSFDILKKIIIKCKIKQHSYTVRIKLSLFLIKAIKVKSSV